MRLTQICPKCACRKFLIVEKFQQPAQESSNGIEPFPVITVHAGGGGGIGNRQTLGQFEAWICTRCGLTEWYAKGLENLDLRAPGPGLRVLDAEPRPGPPYR